MCNHNIYFIVTVLKCFGYIWNKWRWRSLGLLHKIDQTMFHYENIRYPVHIAQTINPNQTQQLTIFNINHQSSTITHQLCLQTSQICSYRGKWRFSLNIIFHKKSLCQVSSICPIRRNLSHCQRSTSILSSSV